MTAALAARKVDMVGVVATIRADPELRAIARPLFTAADAIGRTQISALVGASRSCGRIAPPSPIFWKT
jgi:hypothetical protein